MKHSFIIPLFVLSFWWGAFTDFAKECLPIVNHIFHSLF